MNLCVVFFPIHKVFSKLLSNPFQCCYEGLGGPLKWLERFVGNDLTLHLLIFNLKAISVKTEEVGK